MRLVEGIYETQGELECGGGLSSGDIRSIEIKLEITLPPSCKRLLESYGNLFINGIEFTGISVESWVDMVESTLEYRELGMPEDFVIIADVDEYLYCFDMSSNGEEKEVISCDKFTWGYSKSYDNFMQMFHDFILNDAIVEK